jgi:hypothetical protein
MAVFKVLSDTNGISFEENVGRYLDSTLFLSALAERFHAAKVLADMMGEATSEIAEMSIKLGITQEDARHQMPHESQRSEVVCCSNAVEEAELLDCVAKMVDLCLSTNGKK